MIEGDATYTQTLYVQQVLAAAGAFALLGSANTQPPPNAPRVFLDLLQFPYLQGLTFSSALASQGGVGAIDAAFARLPASSEQVLHAEKYLAAEAPCAVPQQFVHLNGWTIEDEDVLGGYLLQRWLREFGLTPQSASNAAAGWCGDRYLLLRSPAGSSAFVAFVAFVVWDTPGDIDEFVRALFPAPPIAGGPLRTLVNGRPVLFVHVDASTLGIAVASDAAAVDKLAGLLAGSR
ncbi:MAG: hypothetical protein EXR66_09215 [Dehalococcoidia bacterium]|nr:hypothetical protein [Dehalococcoidia bacterium]